MCSTPTPPWWMMLRTVVRDRDPTSSLRFLFLERAIPGHSFCGPSFTSPTLPLTRVLVPPITTWQTVSFPFRIASSADSGVTQICTMRPLIVASRMARTSTLSVLCGYELCSCSRCRRFCHCHPEACTQREMQSLHLASITPSAAAR